MRRPEPPKRDEEIAPVRGSEATIVAMLEGGPLKGRRVETDVVEGRPPKTLDVEGDEGGTCRYVLAELSQGGPTAVYTFLYDV
jgi:hypothetical protein